MKGMLAGGTGITPMYQVINAILRDPSDRTQLSLVSANVGEDDILLRRELDTLAATHDNFRVHYVLNNPPAGALAMYRLLLPTRALDRRCDRFSRGSAGVARVTSVLAGHANISQLFGMQGGYKACAAQGGAAALALCRCRSSRSSCQRPRTMCSC